MKSLGKYLAGVLMVFSFSGSALAEAQVDELLVNRLVEKGVLNQDEASAIRAEAAIKAQEEAEARKKFNVEGKTKIDLGGLIQAQYSSDQSSADQFLIRRARIDLRGAYSRVGWRLQVDAVQPLKDGVSSVSQNSATKDVSTSTTKFVTRPIVLDAYIDYNLDFVNFRVGQFYPAVAKEYLTSAADLDFINYSQITQNFGPDRDIGAQVAGSLDFITKSRVVDYSLAVFNGSGPNASENNRRKDVVGRIQVYPLKNLVLALARYEGRSGSSGDLDRNRTGVGITYAIDNLTLQGEYIDAEDGSKSGNGWYAQAGYKFLKNYEALVRYDTIDKDKDTQNDRTNVTTIGANWYLNKWSKIRANYEWKTEEGAKVKNNVFVTQFQAQF